MRSVKDRLEKVFRGTKIDAILLTTNENLDPNFIYLSGFENGLDQNGVFESHYLIATRRGMTIITNPLGIGECRAQRPREMKIASIDSGKKLIALLRRHLKGRVVGVNGRFISYNWIGLLKKEIKPKKIVDISQAFDSVREVKDRGELGKMRTANAIIKKAVDQARAYLVEGVTEMEMSMHIGSLVIKNGGSAPSFPTIVSFGKNSADPHHMPDSTKLARNTVVMIDAGARYKGYCSDITRTMIFRPDRKSDKYARMADIYNTVARAQKLAMKEYIVGNDASKAHNAAESFINSARGGAYKGKFMHALGHSVGIDVHDGRNAVSPYSKFKFREGMVFSNEPGIYVNGFCGVRLEDDVLITRKGPRIL
ncbi:MAG: aminopeptidase P family protein [Candidatus Micrarchaeota archaeon]|nr:aminopeptidase P family protein [Candidatus Micrarchaeota archaeon]